MATPALMLVGILCLIGVFTLRETFVPANEEKMYWASS